MKKLLYSLILIGTSYAYAQQSPLKSFEKIIVNPHVEVELRKGDTEQIEWINPRIDPEYLIAKVKGKTLHVFIDGVRVTAKGMVNNMLDDYIGPKVKAIVTYTDLRKVTVYGEDGLDCDELTGRKVKLKVAGDNEVNIGPIEADKLKVVLYGDNRLKVAKSLIHKQVFTTYGDNKVFTDKLDGHQLKFTNFGDNKLYTGKHNILSVIAFGDALISYTGDPVLEERLVFGNLDFRSN